MQKSPYPQHVSYHSEWTIRTWVLCVVPWLWFHSIASVEKHKKMWMMCDQVGYWLIDGVSSFCLVPFVVGNDWICLPLSSLLRCWIILISSHLTCSYKNDDDDVHGNKWLVYKKYSARIEYYYVFHYFWFVFSRIWFDPRKYGYLIFTYIYRYLIYFVQYK